MVFSDYHYFLCVLLLVSAAVLSGCTDKPGGNVTRTPEMVPDTPPETNERGPYTAEEVRQLERIILNRTNAERTSRGLSPLSWNNSLAKVADYHAWQMGKKGFRGHVEPDGDIHTNRLRQYGHYCTDDSESEVIAYTRTFEQDTLQTQANQLVNSWMRSKPHRDAILSNRARVSGIGTYVNSTGYVFSVQLLCTEVKDYEDMRSERVYIDS